MAQPSKTSQSAPERVQKHFQEQASSFDELYGTDETNEEAPLQRTLRPGLFRRRELAVSVVRSYDSPRILDVGCGSGRIGEFLMEAGTGSYVGNDFSRPMLELRSWNTLVSCFELVAVNVSPFVWVAISPISFGSGNTGTSTFPGPGM